MDPETSQPAPQPSQSPSEYEAERRRKREELRALGVNPYGRRVEGVTPLAEARAALGGPASPRAVAQDAPQTDAATPGPVFTVAGRIVLKRDMGKLSFLTLRDDTGDLQVGLQKNTLDDTAWEVRNRLDLGDQIVATGPLGTTKTGEPTIWATNLQISSKSLLVPPSKHKGLEDVELRYRQRYVDLWANPEVMRTMQLRLRIVDRMRQFLRDRGFQEVETPMLQPLHGGAAARPFITHHNALDMQLYLRIAPELYLKRLLVGGFRKVFEINRNFRNEGISPRHNPEFTMLEAYEAYGNYATMAELVEEMVCTIAQEVFGTLVIRHEGTEARRHEGGESDGATERRGDEGDGVSVGGPASPRAVVGDEPGDQHGRNAGRVIDLRGDESKPRGQRWRRVRMVDLVASWTSQHLGVEWRFDKRNVWETLGAGYERFWEVLVRHFVRPSTAVSTAITFGSRDVFKIDSEVTETKIREIATDSDRRYRALSPAEQLTDFYERFIEHELIDPTFVTHVPSVIIPLARPSEEDPYFAEVYELAINGQEISPGYTELNDPDVQEQLFRQQVGDEAERQQVDEDFLTALKYGMPPAGGMGLGVDRLVTMLTGAPSLRDVILFPLMRQRHEGAKARRHEGPEPEAG